MQAGSHAPPGAARAVIAASSALLMVTSGCGSGAHEVVDRRAAPAPSEPLPAGGGGGAIGAGGGGGAIGAGGGGGAGGGWLGYHADQARTGAVGGSLGLPLARAWVADLGAAVHGQAVASGGSIVVATEDDRVVALNRTGGRVEWSTTIGSPLTAVASLVGCGDIDPSGITSTPVIDASTGMVYVVGEVRDAGGVVSHRLDGLDLATGAVRISEDVDPPLPAGERSADLLQRAALALGNGRVYVSYGGNDGDCGHYHGWVVGVDEVGAPRQVDFEVAPDGEGGAIWLSGGGPALDHAGNVYVTTGNANPDPPAGGPDPLRYTESVVELTPDLRPLASWKDTAAGGDEDLATGNPVLLPGGEVFAVGKTDTGFLLRQGDLSELAAIPGVCGSDPDGGPAFDAATDRIFVPCRDGGIQEVDVGARRLGPRLSGPNGAPIIVGGDLWAASYPGGTVVGRDLATGSVVQQLDVGQAVPAFTSPTAAYGLLLVPTDTGVTAFAPTGPPTGT